MINREVPPLYTDTDVADIPMIAHTTDMHTTFTAAIVAWHLDNNWSLI
jgi:hypothetical protein